MVDQEIEVIEVIEVIEPTNQNREILTIILIQIKNQIKKPTQL
jgi:hypothetical protein